MELYTWEYEGKQYAGKKSPLIEWNLRYLEDNGEFAFHTRNSVTNLRLAKVVDKDAVVISQKLFEKLLQISTNNQFNEISDGGLWQWLHEIRNENPHLTPPVTEPKGFGAIVEADYEPKHHGKHGKFIFNGVDWILEGTLYNYGWSDLINPTILSEGLK